MKPKLIVSKSIKRNKTDINIRCFSLLFRDSNFTLFNRKTDRAIKNTIKINDIVLVITKSKYINK